MDQDFVFGPGFVVFSSYLLSKCFRHADVIIRGREAISGGWDTMSKNSTHNTYIPYIRPIGVL